MKYDFRNFFLGTRANFTPCERPRREPDFYTWSGSTYWDEGDRVIRWSNHWGPNIRSCCWFFDGRTVSSKHNLCAACSYDLFEPNPDKVVGRSYRARRPNRRRYLRRL